MTKKDWKRLLLKNWDFLKIVPNGFTLMNIMSLSNLLLLSPTSGTAVTLKTGRREVPDSNPGRDCRPIRSEFSVVFSETRVNTG